MISICVPCYEMHGKGGVYLSLLLNSIITQSYKSYEVIISDQSENNIIKKVVSQYSALMDISYHKCDNLGKSSYNLNNAIKKAKYYIIKPMFQDDFFINNESLKIISENSSVNFGGFIFTHFDETGNDIGNTINPSYNTLIKRGNNTIGSPSVVFFKNENNYFNDELVWLMDCEFYERMMLKYKIFNSVNLLGVGIRVWKHSYTYHISELRKNREHSMVRELHG